MTRSTATSMYDDDFFAWTKQQAEALRRLPRDAGAEAIDIEHVAGEIEDLGKRDLRDVTSFLTRLFEHLIKIERSPESQNAPHWRAESLVFRNAAADAYAASMRRLIDLDRIWRRARKLAAASLHEDVGQQRTPACCPFDLDNILSEDFDPDRLSARLAEHRAG